MNAPKRGRGSPPLPARERATEQIHVRCTKTEKAEYRRKSKRDTGKANISAWLKGLADKG
jgi:hypothetical protein